MHKEAFLAALRRRLTGLPEEDIQKSLDYYSEIIDDRIEDGCTEEEAVAAMGPLEEIIRQILMETPLPKLVRAHKRTRRRMEPWEIAVMVLCAPMWLAAAAVVVSLLIALCAVLFSLHVAAVAVGISGVAVVARALLSAGGGMPALTMAGLGVFCIGFAVVMFAGVSGLNGALVKLWKGLWNRLKSRFIREGDVE